MIRQLAHVCLHTNDLDAMVDFYTTALGLPIKFSLRNEADEVVGHYVECGESTFIEIFDQDRVTEMFGGDKVGLRTPATRFQHLCLEVTDLDRMMRHLDAAGVPYLDTGVGLDHSRQIWIGDPDGNAIELMEYTARSLQLVGDGSLAEGTGAA